jgi:hypothetical protein
MKLRNPTPIDPQANIILRSMLGLAARSLLHGTLSADSIPEVNGE